MTGLVNVSKSRREPCQTAVPLEILTKFVSPRIVSNPSKPLELLLAEKRLERFELQNAARRLLPNERVAGCLRVLGFGRSIVEVWHSQQSQRAHYKGLAVCGSVWTCPICAAKITERRRQELVAALEASKYHTTLVTVTLQHEQRDELKSVLSMLRESWRKTRAGKGWQSLTSQYGFVGSITGLESTHGFFGWHPHLHVLFFSRRELLEREREELRGAVSTRYGRYVGQAGGYASSIYGVQVSDKDAAGEYVAKWGEADELTKAAVKKAKNGGRNPFDLLRDYNHGDKQAGALFVEYAQALKGRQQLVWSPGLRALLGLGCEKDDEELAQEQVSKSDTLLALIDNQGWGLILKKRLRGILLEIASSGDAEALSGWLFSHGVLACTPRDWELM